MSHQNPPPHPPDDTTPDAPKNRARWQQFLGDLKNEIIFWIFVGAVLFFVFEDRTAKSVVWTAFFACAALAWSGVARYRRARKPERRQSDKPKEAEAPVERETRTIKALKSDLTLYVLPWFVVGAVLLFVFVDLTAEIAVSMAFFACAALAWSGVARYRRARKPSAH